MTVVDVTLSGRMGGPEIGAEVRAVLVALRRALKSAFAALDIAGLTTLDINAYFNGSVSTYFDATGVVSARYSKNDKRAVLDLCLDSADLRPAFMAGAEAMRDTLTKHGVDGRALSATMTAAFALLERS